jgi:serine/threonine protein kinase
MVFSYLTHGGYANIYYDSNISKVIKQQSLYTYSESKCITTLCESSIYEGILSMSLRNIGNVPIIDSIQISESNVSFKMPYYGISMQDFVKKNSHKDLATISVPIILSLVETCLALYEKNIQHTDIKPANIIIDKKTKRMTLIDFNICSIRSTGQSLYGWSYGIGTWIYAAPEIIFNEEPSNSSMVWSIGVIIAFIYADHPLLEICKNLFSYKQNEMQSLYKEYSIKYKNGLPLSTKHKDCMPSTIKHIFKQCTQWDWKKRLTIRELYNVLTKALSNELPYETSSPSLLHYNENTRFIPYKNTEKRNTSYKILWKICKITQRFDILCRAMLLFDKYATLNTQHNEYSFIGCVYIAFIISGKILSDSKLYEINTLLDNVSFDCVNEAIVHTLKVFDWKCYFQVPDVFIVDTLATKYNISLYDIQCDNRIHRLIYNIIYSMDKVYTITDIVENTIAFKDNECKTTNEVENLCI